MIEKDNIILIGMPGAGKSTLGVVLAKILNYQFVDCDLIIQQKQDRTLQEIIDTEGVEAFIQIEGDVLANINATKSIISTGGSAIYSDEGMKHLSEIGRVVYLKISYEQLTTRLTDLQERGVVMKEGMSMSLSDLFAERAPLYEKYAHTTVDVDDLSITAAARKVAAAVS